MKKLTIFAITIATIILILVYYVVTNNVDKKISLFILYGKNEYTIYEREIFNDPGYIILDKNNKEINDNVVVTNNLNNNVPGTYTITYKYGNFLSHRTLVRTITVLEDKLKEIDFSILGDNITIVEDEVYTDPGYKCTFKVNNADCSNYVTVDDTDINNTVGNYEIRYILDYNDNKKVIKREVKVIPTPYYIETSEDKPTNKDVVITFTNNLENYGYIIGPDDNKTTDNKLEYTVSKNGIYTFSIYDTNNNCYTKELKIDYIDKEAPIVKSCIIKNNKFEIDSNETIKKIKYNDKTYSLEDNIDEINDIVKLYDEATNYTEAYCKNYYTERSYSDLTGLTRENKSDTISYKMYKYTNYMVTTIWVDDLLEQYHMANYELGKVAKVSDILDKAINTYKLDDKIVLGFNASGFIVNGSYGQSFYNLNHSYNNSSESPYIIERGKVIRNLSAYVPENKPTMGFNKYGQMKFYEFKKAKNDESINKNVIEEMKNDGVQDTVTFGPILVKDGEVASNSTDNNLRQGFCQVDNNNFIIITNITSRSSGFNFKKLGTYMKELGCINGYNLDGGGSITVVVHENNKTEIIRGNSRSDADIIYFYS